LQFGETASSLQRFSATPRPSDRLRVEPEITGGDFAAILSQICTHFLQFAFLKSARAIFQTSDRFTAGRGRTGT
jgi:hypothetical protein